MSAREEILARVRSALADAPRPPSAAPRVVHGGPAGLALFEERLRDYKAEGHRVPPDAVGTAVEQICRRRRWVRVGVPPGLPNEWRPREAEVVEDTGLAPDDLDRLDAVVTATTFAVAETGTLILSGAPAEGRRALTLIPDVHICIVLAEQIVSSVTAAFQLLAPGVEAERRPLTLISGPSATSDIELSRVEGVHGPRTLVVLVAAEES